MEYLISEDDRELLRDIIMQSDLDDEDKIIAENIFEDTKKQPVKLLDRQEVEKIFDTLTTDEDVYENESTIYGIDDAITAICNLVVLEVSK